MTYGNLIRAPKADAEKAFAAGKDIIVTAIIPNSVTSNPIQQKTIKIVSNKESKKQGLHRTVTNTFRNWFQEIGIVRMTLVNSSRLQWRYEWQQRTTKKKGS